MTRRTKIRIRKTVAFTRTLFLVFALIFLGLTIASVNGPSFVFPTVCGIVFAVCAIISYALDCLLFETAWNGDNSSPFTH